MSKEKLYIYWLRRDFRTTDNPALYHISQISEGCNFLPIFCLDENLLASKNLGLIRRKYLARLLLWAKETFPNFVIFHSSPSQVFSFLDKHFEIEIFANDDIEPYSRKRDLEIGQKFNLQLFADQLTINPETRSGSGNIYSVFTPFKNAVWQSFLDSPVLPVVEPKNIFKNLELKAKIRNLSEFENLKIVENPELALDLESNILSVRFENVKNYNKFENDFTTFENENIKIDLNKIGVSADINLYYQNENQAILEFEKFLDKIEDYNQDRNFLAKNGVSGMSVALKWGLVSPRFLKQRILEKGLNLGSETYLTELIWREFYKYLLLHRPELLDTEFQSKFQGSLNWVDGDLALERFISWIDGKTGYPLVDAAMNEIKQKGWMHNRTRMVVASILTKNLGIDWRFGQEYFRAVLLDLDEANNSGGWQWAASVGSDPKPIRIFNPSLQAKNYDSENLYQKKYLPKNTYKQSDNLFNNDKKFEYLLTPILDHKIARQEAINRYNLAKIFKDNS
jgi:deoxyribodipyrimidine photo-lyase